MRRTLVILIAALVMAGCQRPPMVLPTMFAAGQVDPFADLPEARRDNKLALFFATDRVYKPEKPGIFQRDDWRHYTRMRSVGLDLGRLEVTFGPHDAWPKISAAANNLPRGKRYSPHITDTARLGEIGRATHQPPDSDDTKPQTHDPGRRFIHHLNLELEHAPGNAVTVYIHGFKNGFEQAALTAAEYDLYTGGLGPFIAYSWPSYNSVWEYSHDRDSVRYTTAHARMFFEYLADQINSGKLKAEKINVIAHSSGAEVIGSVLRELALMSRGNTPQERRKLWRLGTIALVAGDISIDVARERVLKEDLRGMYDQIVAYSSPRDRALRWASRVLYRTTRLGSVSEEDLTEQDRRLLSHAKQIALIDIDDQPNDDFVHHSHHRFSAAVASDIILCLRTGLTPEERGLVREDGRVMWRFADDYAQRVTESAREAYSASE